MTDPLLALDSAKIGFKERVLFQDLNLTFKDQEIVCLLGPSGGGKSTLLKTLAGLLPLQEGSLSWSEPASGKPLQNPPKVGFVFQEPVLLPWKNVLENTRLPLEIGNNPCSNKEEVLDISREALQKVRLHGIEDLYPHQLSGGMRMRVSIARALVSRPSVLFMDEPFAALDETARFHLQEELRELAKLHRMTILFVTHSLYEAAFLADRVMILGPGRIVLDENIHYSGSRQQSLRRDSEYLSVIEKLGQRMAEL